MRATIEFIKERYDYFNRHIFGGRLPDAPISLCQVTSFVGQFKSKVRNHPDGRIEHYDWILRFSTLFDLPERELEDTIIHEMIHFFIAYNGLHDRTAHGRLFKALMESINETHGRRIGISHRTTSHQMQEAAEAKKKWHVVAILTFRNGSMGVKVLPRVVPKIIEYHNKVAMAPNVRKIELYLHNDGFFNRFPTSAALRCHKITEEEAKNHLKGAHVLRVKGNKLEQR